MNKIEPGCRAVIVNSQAGNNGIVVTVLGIAGEPGLDFTNPREGLRWEIDASLNTTWGETLNHASEHNLQRLKDDDHRQPGSFEALKDIWVPEKLGETV